MIILVIIFIIVIVFILMFFAKGKRNRHIILDQEIRALINSGQKGIDLRHIYFEAALKFALENGATLEHGTPAIYTNSIGFIMNINGINYFIYFSKLHDGSTFLGVSNNDETKQRFRERYGISSNIKETATETNLKEMIYHEDELVRMANDEFSDEDENDFGFYDTSDGAIELIDIIKRTNNLPEGIFANINNDLNESIREDHPPIIQMAYSYARRSAAAGLFLQGVFSREDYLQASTIFKAFQMRTEQTVEFQEEAARQSCELLSSYDSRLEKKAITVITSMVELNKASGLYTGNGKTNIPYELVISGIQKVADKLK